MVGAHSSAEAGVEVEVDGHSSCSSRSSQRTEGEVQSLEAWQEEGPTRMALEEVH